MANMNMKGIPTSLAIMGMEIKAMMRHHYKPNRRAKRRERIDDNRKSWEEAEKRDPSYVHCYSHLGNSLEGKYVLTKTPHLHSWALIPERRKFTSVQKPVHDYS